MNPILDDCFVVMVREEDSTRTVPNLVERELVSCPTYEQAHWIKRECSRPGHKCIIRFVGTSGGGD